MTATTLPESRTQPLLMFATMARIRCFEEEVERLHRHGRVPGAAHLYIGEEAVAVGACAALQPTDRITSTHRGHGHLIAKGADVRLMMAELFGRRDGYCRGKGGSMHICDVSLGILGANGIVGGGIPIATGSALADSVLGRDGVTVCFFGDGAANQGVLHEGLNLSAVWRLPVIYICENNQYNEWTPMRDVTAGRIADRSAAFGVPGAQLDGNDVFAVRDAVAEAVKRARAGEGPSLFEAVTYRQRGHEEGEEAYGAPIRDQAEVAPWIERDPLVLLRRRLTDEFGLDVATLDEILATERALVEEAVRFAEASPLPDAAELLDDLFATRRP